MNKTVALARHVGDQFNVAEALAGLSAQAALDGEHIEAARLAGASTELHERIGAPPWASVTAIHERALTEARLVLGAEAFAALVGRRSPRSGRRGHRAFPPGSPLSSRRTPPARDRPRR